MPIKYVTGERPLRVSVNTDSRVLKLVNAHKDPTVGWQALSLYLFLVVKRDNLGRHEADEDYVKYNVLQGFKAVDEPLVEKLITWIHDCGLAFRYRHNGGKYLQLLGAHKHRLVGNMMFASELPAPPEPEFREWLAKVRGCSKEKIEELVECYCQPPRKHHPRTAPRQEADTRSNDDDNPSWTER